MVIVGWMVDRQRHGTNKSKRVAMDLFTRRNVIEEYGMPDIHGELCYMEAAPGDRIRFWICQRRGNRSHAVSKIVMPIWPLIHARVAVGHWLAANGYREGCRPEIIH